MKDIIVNEILMPALQLIYRVDHKNIDNGVSERNICARLAHHMENFMSEYNRTNHFYLFDNYHADVEYNKMADGDPKTYENIKHLPINMVSDLVIHNRTSEPNYLAVEMKREENYHHVKEDRERLKSMVSPRPANEKKRCVHDTLIGAFIIYGKKGVKIELFEYNGLNEVSTKNCEFSRQDLESYERLRVNLSSST